MIKVLLKEEYCIGCGLCKVHCTAEHSQSRDLIKAFKKEYPQPVPRVRIERAEDTIMPVRCQQCEEPACMYSCLTGAIYKDDDGRILLDGEKCIGCWTCILACPNAGLLRDKVRNIAAKCDLCPGRDTPACVANCPNGALIIETIQDGN